MPATKMSRAKTQRRKEISLFFVAENLEIRYYAFSETAPGKSGPFGAVETSNSPCA